MQAASQAAMLSALNITLGGAFATSGSFTTTLTVTANTNVTLPNSGTLAILAANAFTALQTVTLAPGAATVAVGLQLSNVTAATTGNQQYSPALRFTGQGFHTSVSSKASEFQIFSVPVQQGYGVDGTLRFQYSQNGGAFAELLDISSINTTVRISKGLGTPLQIGGTGGNSALQIIFNGVTIVDFTGAIIISDAYDMRFGTTTGTKIGTATTQKLGFWNATPIIQPTTAIAASTFVANTSLIANDTATWDSYTIGQVVKALRNAGILA